jgi:hypothetical protein
MAAAFLSACGRQERSVVDEFFAQSRLRDKTALQKVATVTFEPRVQGIVEQFEITKVTPEENQTKTVTVSAQVKLPNGTVTHEVIVLTMSHGLITGFLGVPFQEAPAAPRS